MKKIFLTFPYILAGFIGFGQQKPVAAGKTQMAFFDSSDVVIPILIKAALQNAPQMAILSTEKQTAENSLELAKKEFLRDINLHSGYNYGNINTIIPHSDLQPIQTFYGGNQARYSFYAGIGVGVSLEQFFGGKKLRTDRQKLAIQQSEAEIKEGEKVIRNQVITLYQSVKLARVVVKHTQDALQTAYVNKTMAEKQFKEGNMQVSEQMTADQLYTSALLAAEEAKNRYQTNLFLLEELVGIPILPLLGPYLNK